MAIQLSEYLEVSKTSLEENDVYDTVIGLDTRLFVDPTLFEITDIPEFKNGREKIKEYYSPILTLLSASTYPEDRAWMEAKKRLIFKEVKGVSIGYGATKSDGNGIGPKLAGKLVKSAKEIIDMGIKDPEIFELLGLLEEDFGPDRLSDMTIVILKENFYSYSARITKNLKLTKVIEVKFRNQKFILPKHPYKNEPLILLPKSVLRDLPIALIFDDVTYIAEYNAELRKKLNEIIGADWKAKAKKSLIRRKIFSSKTFFEEVLQAYKTTERTSYNFEDDPSSESSGYDIGRQFAKENPLTLPQGTVTTIAEVKTVVEKIIEQFKRNIEDNGLNTLLYYKKKPRHERYSQVIFYSIADTYCASNNLDLSREPSAGNGPVDFKVSSGYKEKILVEIKLSSNTKMLKGFQKQLPAYEKAENTNVSYYVILKVTESSSQIEAVKKLQELSQKRGKKVPNVIIVDATLKPSASNRK